MQSDELANLRTELVLDLIRERIKLGMLADSQLLAWVLPLAELGAEHPAAKRHDKEIAKIELAKAAQEIEEKHGVSERRACEMLHEANAKGFMVADAGTIRQAVRREKERQAENRRRFWKEAADTFYRLSGGTK